MKKKIALLLIIAAFLLGCAEQAKKQKVFSDQVFSTEQGVSPIDWETVESAWRQLEKMSEKHMKHPMSRDVKPVLPVAGSQYDLSHFILNDIALSQHREDPNNQYFKHAKTVNYGGLFALRLCVYSQKMIDKEVPLLSYVESMPLQFGDFTLKPEIFTHTTGTKGETSIINLELNADSKHVAILKPYGFEQTKDVGLLRKQMIFINLPVKE